MLTSRKSVESCIHCEYVEILRQTRIGKLSSPRANVSGSSMHENEDLMQASKVSLRYERTKQAKN